MRNKFAKYINSFPGMTVWMFCIYFAINTLFFGYSPMQGAIMSAITSVPIAFLFSRNFRKNTPFLAKNIKENHFDRMRQFKKYVQKNELPVNKDEYLDFMQYLQELDTNHAKRSLKSEKITMGVLGALGVFILMVDTVQSGLLFIAIAVFFAFQIKASTKARKAVPVLKEKLALLIEG